MLNCGGGRSLVNFQLRKIVDDLHRFKADCDDSLEQFQRVAGVVHGFGGPEVGIVHNAAVFVGGDGLAFHDPVDGGFAVDDVVVGFKGNAGDGDVLVVDHGGLVVDALAGLRVFALGVLHLDDSKLLGFQSRQFPDAAGEFERDGMALYGLVVQMPVSQIPPRLCEFLKVVELLHGWNARWGA